MSIQTRVLAALRDLINATEPFAPVAMGALPAGDGLCMAVSTGRNSALTLANSYTAVMDVALTCKHADRAAALDALCLIQEALTGLQALPSGENWQMISVRTDGAPGYLDRDGERWLYGGTLAVTYAAEGSADQQQ